MHFIEFRRKGFVNESIGNDFTVVLFNHCTRSRRNTVSASEDVSRARFGWMHFATAKRDAVCRVRNVGERRPESTVARKIKTCRDVYVGFTRLHRFYILFYRRESFKVTRFDSWTLKACHVRDTGQVRSHVPFAIACSVAISPCNASAPIYKLHLLKNTVLFMRLRFTKISVSYER